MVISREPIQEDKQVNAVPGDAREPGRYVPPKLEKMQKLAQVTGSIVTTGVMER